MDNKVNEEEYEEELTETKEEQRLNKKRFIIQLIISGIILIICIALTVYFWPKFKEINDNKEEFKRHVENMGFSGVFILIAISCIQVILAVIPGEVVEIVCGMMYGTWGGLIIYEIGITIGCASVYYLVKLLGTGFAKSMVNVKFQRKMKLFGDPRRVEVIMFFILLMPGVPKDMVAFVTPMTKVKLHRFLIINAVARIPSIVASTMLGSSVIKGKYEISIIVMVVSGIIGLLGLIFNKKIVNFIVNKNNNSYDNTQANQN